MSATPSRAVAIALVAVLAAACAATPPPTSPPGSPAPGTGSPAPSSPSTPPASSPSAPPSAAPASLILKVTSEGGFINPAATLASLPIVAVYADGRIMTPAPVAAVDPGPLLPTLSVRAVGPDGVAAILAAIHTVGLDTPATAGPGIPGDSGTDVFTVIVDGATTTSRFAGGGPPGPGGPGAGGSGDPERGAAIELLNRLIDPAETWGASAAPETTFAPIAYRVYVAPAAPQTGPPPVAWPLATPLDAFGTAAVPDRGVSGLRQGVVLGADASRLGPLLQAATLLTTFTSGGKSWTLFVRPLLPDEVGG